MMKELYRAATLARVGQIKDLLVQAKENQTLIHWARVCNCLCRRKSVPLARKAKVAKVLVEGGLIIDQAVVDTLHNDEVFEVANVILSTAPIEGSIEITCSYAGGHSHHEGPKCYFGKRVGRLLLEKGARVRHHEALTHLAKQFSGEGDVLSLMLLVKNADLGDWTYTTRYKVIDSALSRLIFSTKGVSSADRLQLVQTAISKGAAIDLSRESFNNGSQHCLSPLVVAAKIGDIALFQFLHEQGADLDYSTGSFNGYEDIYNLVRNRLETKDRAGWGILMYFLKHTKDITRIWYGFFNQGKSRSSFSYLDEDQKREALGICLDRTNPEEWDRLTNFLVGIDELDGIKQASERGWKPHGTLRRAIECRATKIEKWLRESGATLD